MMVIIVPLDRARWVLLFNVTALMGELGSHLNRKSREQGRGGTKSVCAKGISMTQLSCKQLPIGL